MSSTMLPRFSSTLCIDKRRLSAQELKTLSAKIGAIGERGGKIPTGLVLWGLPEGSTPNTVLLHYMDYKNPYSRPEDIQCSIEAFQHAKQVLEVLDIPFRAFQDNLESLLKDFGVTNIVDALKALARRFEEKSI